MFVYRSEDQIQENRRSIFERMENTINNGFEENLKKRSIIERIWFWALDFCPILRSKIERLQGKG